MDVALVSCRNLPEPDPDAAPLAAALAAAGIRARVLAWDDPEADWSAARLTLFRSAWNYPLHRAAFLAWAERAAALSRLCNRLELVRWNSHKSYLLDLERAGIAITPTALVPHHATIALAEIMAERGWAEVVIKPAVGAASLNAYRFAAADTGDSGMDAGEAHLRALAAAGDVLVQRFLPSIHDHGERALMWIDGAVTHAVRKSPRFAGQSESV